MQQTIIAKFEFYLTYSILVFKLIFSNILPWLSIFIGSVAFLFLNLQFLITFWFQFFLFNFILFSGYVIYTKKSFNTIKLISLKNTIWNCLCVLIITIHYLFINNIFFTSKNFTILLSGLFNYSIIIDPLTLILILLTGILIFICVLSSWSLILYKINFFYFILFSLEFILFNLFLTSNLMLFYLFFEGLLIPMTFLIGIWGTRKRKIYANYFFFFLHL